MLLNVALAVLVGLLGWYLKQKWDEGKEQERRVRMATISPPPVPLPPPLRKVSPIDGPSYGEVATRNLFSATSVDQLRRLSGAGRCFDHERLVERFGNEPAIRLVQVSRHPVHGLPLRACRSASESCGLRDTRRNT